MRPPRLSGSVGRTNVDTETMATHASMIRQVTATLQESKAAVDRILTDHVTLESIAAAGELLAQALATDGRVFSCGNGGSMCDAIHFAEELSGRYRRDRRPLAAVAISDPGHLTCVANDFGYEQVFARYLEAHGRAGDILLAISTSGQSPNVIRAAERAKDRHMRVVALTGKRGSALGLVADLEISADGGSCFADRSQELHIKVIHILVELVERQLFPENYADGQ